MSRECRDTVGRLAGAKYLVWINLLTDIGGDTGTVHVLVLWLRSMGRQAICTLPYHRPMDGVRS